VYDVIIIGAGPAGLTAGIYASHFKLKTLIVGKMPGGYISESYEIKNYPGFKSIKGHELTQKLVEHAIASGAELKTGVVVTKVRKLKNKFEVITSSGKRYDGKALILAYGLKRRKLNVPGEDKFLGKGVSYCAVCDAIFFRNKIVGVVGGANSAVTGALQLAEVAKKVYIIYRRDKLRADPVWVERALKNPKIEVIYNTNVVEIKGKERVEYVILDNPYKGNKKLKLNGLFIEIGFVPDMSLAEQLGVAIDENGFIKINQDCSTNVEGVFAAGDLTNGSNNIKQIITAASEGAIAAISVYSYLRR
jgi:thioredoxin reductase (NADPH)